MLGFDCGWCLWSVTMAVWMWAAVQLCRLFYPVYMANLCRMLRWRFASAVALRLG